jgi:hypothetical protein
MHLRPQWRDAFASVFLGSVRLSRAAAAELGDGGVIGFVLSTSMYEPIMGLAVSNALRPGLAGAVNASRTATDGCSGSVLAENRRAQVLHGQQRHLQISAPLLHWVAQQLLGLAHPVLNGVLMQELPARRGGVAAAGIEEGLDCLP